MILLYDFIGFKDKAFAELPTKEKLEQYPAILRASGYVGKASRNKNEYDFHNGCYRLPSILELERLMTFPDGYISGVEGISRTEKMKLVGLSFTADVVAHLLKGLAE